MRILHTSDWHLGHTLHDVQRHYEEERFLQWLVEVLCDKAVDALLLTGDIFESANPSPAAQRLYYEFLDQCRRRCPDLDIVIIAGNHDSASRLEAPARLLSAFRTTVVGALKEEPQERERAIVELRNRHNQVGALVLAVPYLRPCDLGAQKGESLTDTVRRIYREMTEMARARRQKGQALLAMGHLYMVGGNLSERSERRIQIGNQEALPPDLFAEDLAYVALGHLHRAQRVDGKDHLRYAGSPIPLAMNERDYQHQVVLVTLSGEQVSEIQPIFCPRTVPLLVLPEEHAPLEEVVQQLLALPRLGDGTKEEERPFLEVRVVVDQPTPRLRQEIENALVGRWPRLVRIDLQRCSAPRQAGNEALHTVPTLPKMALRDLTPEEIFLRCYKRRYESDPPAEIERLFLQLLESVSVAS